MSKGGERKPPKTSPDRDRKGRADPAPKKAAEGRSDKGWPMKNWQYGCYLGARQIGFRDNMSSGGWSRPRDKNDRPPEDASP